MNRCCLWPVFCGLLLAADPGHEIEGRVVNAVSGAPIVHARVSITFPPSTEPVWLLTDDGGAFDLKNAPEGNYLLNCERVGYLSAHTGGRSAPDSNSPDAKPTLLLVRLMPQAVIEGTVVDENGVVVPSADVPVFLQAIVDGHRRPQLWSTAQADDTGSFRIFGLSAGRYRVGVTAPISDTPRTKVAYRPVFYPNSPDINGGELMDLAPGQEKHLRIRLPEPVPAREISGQVMPTGDTTIVQLRPADATSPHQFLGFQNQWVEKTKTFKISGVPSGAYDLEVTTSLDGQQLRATMMVTVGNRDITGIRLEPRAPATVSGVVRFEGKEKPVVTVSRLVLRSSHGQFATQAATGGDGNFKFNGLPDDTYRLVILYDGPVYLRSAWQGGRDVLRDGLVVTAGSASAPLEIVLDGPGATVEGSIDLPDSGQPANVIVALLQQAGNELVLEKQAYVNRSLPAGMALSVSRQPPIYGGNRFTIQGVAPGDYVLYCWPADSPVPYADGDFLPQYGTLGKAITVNGTEKISVNIDRLVPRIDP